MKNILLIILVVAWLTGCGLAKSGASFLSLNELKLVKSTAEEVPPVVDPLGPIPPPVIPEELQAASKNQPAAISSPDQPAPYIIACSAEGAPELQKIFEQNSRLALLLNDPPKSTAGLEQRFAVSLKEARDMLDSQGYYEGTVQGWIEPPSDHRDKAVVKVVFTPGPRYVIGSNSISPAEGGRGWKMTQPGSLPATLVDVGLPDGSPAVADDVLDAVAKIPPRFRNQGYPFAETVSTHYLLDRPKRQLEAEINVDPGEFTLMGPVTLDGESPVSYSYIAAQQTWKTGQPWRQDLVDDYRTALRQSGLFQSVNAAPADQADKNGQRSVMLKLAQAPARTVGGMLNYDSDFGLGLQAYWEHRNLTGNGDRLRLDMPIWSDLQEIVADYRYPFFKRPDQDFIASAGVFHHDGDAYKIFAASASAGLERRLSRRWRASLKGSVEGGELEDPGEPRQDYYMLGMPLSFSYDGTNDLLDATRGARIMVDLAPYTGEYHDDFTLLRSRLEGRFFLPLNNKALLALRGVWGGVWGAPAHNIPPSTRFYSGGGGSVRGYDYQSIGPHNALGDPLGGKSLMEVSAETRYKLTESFGLVAFIDGGMVYEETGKDFFKDFLWGAGLGVRYYTPIGPVRLDLAAPLNPQDGDDALKIYISIGQSF